MKDPNYFYSMILSILTKTTLTLVICLVYLFFYFGPKFEKNIKEKLLKLKGRNNKKNIKNTTIKDILILYGLIITLLFFSIIIFYIYIKKNNFVYHKDNTFILELIFGGLFSLYLIHYSLENYSLNIYNILQNI